METKLTIEGSKILKQITDSDKRVIVLEGGARSTKTWSILQWIVVNCFKETGNLYMIGRLKMTWSRMTVLRDFYNIWKKYELPITPEFNAGRPEQIYSLNGNDIIFVGMDEPLKLHGVSPDYVWINEAMEASYKDYQQFVIRCKKRIFLDYNPSAETHWIYDNIIPDPDCDYFHSTMRDNPWLEQAIINELNKLEKTDPIAYKIYNLGLRAAQKGLIFHNWEIVRYIPPDARDVALGLDFGYVNDPTAVIRVCYFEGELYVDELIYETGLVNVPIMDKHGVIGKNISTRLGEVGVKPHEEIIGDSAEMKSIHELYVLGWNIHPARKVLITFGLDILHRYKINVTERSVNLIKELRNYKWAVDKEGEPVKPPKPIDAFNHCLDGLRYVAVFKLSQRREGMKRIN